VRWFVREIDDCDGLNLVRLFELGIEFEVLHMASTHILERGVWSLELRRVA